MAHKQPMTGTPVDVPQPRTVTERLGERADGTNPIIPHRLRDDATEPFRIARYAR